MEYQEQYSVRSEYIKGKKVCIDRCYAKNHVKNHHRRPWLDKPVIEDQVQASRQRDQHGIRAKLVHAIGSEPIDTQQGDHVKCGSPVYQLFSQLENQGVS